MKTEIIHNIPDYDGIGIYSITNDRTAKKYIGSSKNVRTRLIQHQRSFQTLKCSLAFKQDIENGDTFTADLLEQIDYGVNQFYVFERESYYIQMYNTLKNGYNHARTTASTKKELLESLTHFQNNSEMTQYLLNIIKKREIPIFKDTITKTKPYSHLKICLPQSTIESLYSFINSKSSQDIDHFINQAIIETINRHNIEHHPVDRDSSTENSGQC